MHSWCDFNALLVLQVITLDNVHYRILVIERENKPSVKAGDLVQQSDVT
jgi:hypothetical protein